MLYSIFCLLIGLAVFILIKHFEYFVRFVGVSFLFVFMLSSSFIACLCYVASFITVRKQ